MRYFMKRLLFFGVIFMFTNAQAATPEQVVKKLVNAIKLKRYGAELSEKDSAYNLKMTRMAATSFDLERMAKTALSDHWDTIDSETQELLVTKIRDLVLKMAYPATNPDVQKIQIVYKGQKITGTEAVVNSLLIIKDKELKIDYRLYQTGQNWFIFDVLSEGRSLIDDYKKQFNKVIEMYSVDKLLEILDNKLKG